MTARGAKLDAEQVGIFARSMVLGNIYPSDIGGFFDTQSADESARYLWNNPDQRLVRWKKVDTSTVACGRGHRVDAGSSDWPFAGAYWQASFYTAKEGRLTREDGDRLSEGEGDAVWIQFEGEFSNGMKNTTRLVFYYSEPSQCWIPLVVYMGLAGDIRPFPML